MSEITGSSSEGSADYRHLWAKSKPETYPLWRHLLDAAGVSLALGEWTARCSWSPEQMALLVGLHDIGKADGYFQHQVPSISEELQKVGWEPTGDAPCRHERLSARFTERMLKTEAGLSPYTASAIARATVAHHGYWIEAPREVAPEYAAAQQAISDLLRRVLDVAEFPKEVSPDLSAFGMSLAGRIVLCDWIASNERFFTDSRLKGIEDPAVYFAKTKAVAREWIETLGFRRDDVPPRPAEVVKTPRPLQQALLEGEVPPGLVIVEAPMGEGKTEAAWILAERWREHGYRGMYMALPTMATSDSLFGRYQDDYLKRLGRGEDTKLVHGMAWLRDEKEPEKPPQSGEPGDDPFLAAAWFRPTRRAMLAPHGVGTVDQAMLAGMHVKFGFLRLFGLTGRALVIDEIHAYDAYMSAIIGRLLQWCACLKIPVVLLSATLSAKQRTAMLEAYGATGGDPGAKAPYPLITVAKPGKEARTITAEASSSRTLRIETHPGLLGEAKKTASLALKLVEHGGCCCVIVNTVKQAQAVYQELGLPQNEKLLFHARFTASDRKRLTDQILDLFGKDTTNRPAKYVLVATQVVEQSLDVDFDYMISEIAPMDLLLQRSGRLHRHRRRDHDPAIHVLLPEGTALAFGGTGYVYADKPLLRTLAILAGQSEIHLPDEFRKLIERCYSLDEWEQGAIPWTAIREADEDWDKEAQSLHRQGRQFALCEPSKRLFRPVNNDPTGDDSDDGNGWRARTRLGANDRTAILVEPEELPHLEQGELPMKEIRALYQRSLKLPNYLPIRGPAQGYLAGVEAQGKLRGLLLLPLDGQGQWQGLDEKGNLYRVAYDKEVGLLAGRVQ